MSTNPNLVRNISCFRDLSKDQIKNIAQIANAVCYPPNQVLFREGEPGQNLYFLVKGKIEVLYNIEDAGQVHVDTVSAEEVFECSALIEPYTYTATMRTTSETEVLVVDAIALRELMQKDCRLGFILQQQIIKLLIKRVINFRLESR